jgi:hypothetical protein
MLRTVELATQRIHVTSRALLSWAGPLMVKLWLSFAFFFR